jgi:hypothetical protein
VQDRPLPRHHRHQNHRLVPYLSGRAHLKPKLIPKSKVDILGLSGRIQAASATGGGAKKMSFGV